LVRAPGLRITLLVVCMPHPVIKPRPPVEDIPTFLRMLEWFCSRRADSAESHAVLALLVAIATLTLFTSRLPTVSVGRPGDLFASGPSAVPLRYGSHFPTFIPSYHTLRVFF